MRYAESGRGELWSDPSGDVFAGKAVAGLVPMAETRKRLETMKELAIGFRERLEARRECQDGEALTSAQQLDSAVRVEEIVHGVAVKELRSNVAVGVYLNAAAKRDNKERNAVLRNIVVHRG